MSVSESVCVCVCVWGGGGGGGGGIYRQPQTACKKHIHVEY